MHRIEFWGLWNPLAEWETRESRGGGRMRHVPCLILTQHALHVSMPTIANKNIHTLTQLPPTPVHYRQSFDPGSALRSRLRIRFRWEKNATTSQDSCGWDIITSMALGSFTVEINFIFSRYKSLFRSSVLSLHIYFSALSFAHALCFLTVYVSKCSDLKL